MYLSLAAWSTQQENGATDSLNSKVILTTTSMYNFQELVPFFKTLSVTSDARVVVFGIHNGQSLVESIKATGAEYIDCSGQYSLCSESLVSAFRILRRTRGLRKYFHKCFHLLGRNKRVATSLETYFCGLQSQRYAVYLDWLADQRCEEVVTSDIRDVVFQSDPFALQIQKLEIAVEPAIRVTRNEHNHMWLTAAFGKECADSYIGNKVSCSGVTAGPKNEMLSYFELMTLEIHKLRGFVGPIDQAVHNHVWYSGQLKNHSALENGDARVLTLQYEDMSRLNIVDRRLVFDKESKVPIIHQHDRHQKTTDFVRDVLLK